MEKKVKHLPKELKVLVNKVVALLGEVIKEEGGNALYHDVELIRAQMIKYRGASDTSKDKILSQVFNKLNKTDKESKHQIAHAYTLMLELINTCEAAYRTYRLKESHTIEYKGRQDNMMVYVLTAHPTEARTPQNIELFRRIQSVAIRILDKSGEEEYMKSIIKHNLKLAWMISVTRHEKPEVIDEANHLFSIILRPDIFDTILRADRDVGSVRIRTWVGGDKDGHPGVDEKVMIQCLQASRNHFIIILERLFNELKKDIELIASTELADCLKKVSSFVLKLKKLQQGDSLLLKELKTETKLLDEAYVKLIGMQSPRLKKIQSIFTLFPGLVIPIELREDSELILESLNTTNLMAIERMLRTLAKISEQGHIRDYVQGMIISMCQSYADVQNAIKLVKRTTNALDIPIIPLFETAEALENSPGIVESMIKDKEYAQSVKSKWKNHLEVMLGYSDSSKGMGVLPSRIAIAKTMRSLDLIITQNKMIPVFFHGSGGSVDRGGGSIQEQTAWWPKSALNLYKATIQGEMVERNFTSPEVSMSGVNKILANFNRVKSKKGIIKIDKAVEDFADLVKKQYVTKIHEESFFRMVEQATPYSYLSVLKLGSRPSKRSTAKKLDFSSIRAIPWILCWTQTRILFRTWWGVGKAWCETKKDKTKISKLKKSYKTSFLFASYVRTLGFTLSKVDLSIFKLYLRQSELTQKEQKIFFKEFESEFKDTVSFVKSLTGQKNLLWYKPWLSDSIELRSSMIHPLNILQIIGNNEKDLVLVRKSVAGISSGMMTTG